MKHVALMASSQIKPKYPRYQGPPSCSGHRHFIDFVSKNTDFIASILTKTEQKMLNILRQLGR